LGVQDILVIFLCAGSPSGQKPCQPGGNSPTVIHSYCIRCHHNPVLTELIGTVLDWHDSCRYAKRFGTIYARVEKTLARLLQIATTMPENTIMISDT
jgi:hypothetical protein